MSETKARQLVYHSQAVGSVDTTDILERSRHNNALDRITGILWFDGQAFVQVLESSDESVAATSSGLLRMIATERFRSSAIEC
ncbi:MAG TPA: BLUF domain-containing protein [Sphingomicrobium sp.]